MAKETPPSLAKNPASQVIARWSTENRDATRISRHVDGAGVGSSGDSPGQPKPRPSEVPASSEPHAVCPSNPTLELPASAV